MATKIRETEAYEMWLCDDGTFSASLKGGISAGGACCATEIEAVEGLLVGQRDLVNQRNEEQRALRNALPQFWLDSHWRREDEPATTG